MPESLSQPHPSHSQRAFATAQRYFPGGVNSPVRAFRAVGGEPPVIASGRGSHIVDVDGRSYIDYVGAYGPLILGHAPPAVIEAINAAAAKGTSFGMPTELETELAALICDAMPSIEMLRFVSSGTEAAMSALRLARAFTGRDLIVKLEGCYHGHSDSLLVKAGSGVATLGLPGSAGVPAAIVSHTLVAPYNDAGAIARLFERYPGQIAAVILEPVPANMGVVLPRPGYLDRLRELTAADGSLLIFDEVITGFRLAPGGAQELLDITPDLTCLGKVIGGGLPVGAYGGRREIMEQVAPLGPMYQAGTLSGNPLAMAAGAATLRALQKPGVYERLERLGALLENGLREAAEHAEMPAQINRAGSLLTMFCAEGEVCDYDSALQSDTTAYAHLHAGLLQRGVFLAPSQFEAVFISLAHSEEDIAATVDALGAALRP
ncbi:MAG TPA: glutamate-1-semialdehyde 2,1-aminomutase [Dehalococcoidia bacterium]|nr:glutamate-1-semialdehyde 2,1-aminomutase [Dehalococcoidia bacterium]